MLRSRTVVLACLITILAVSAAAQDRNEANAGSAVVDFPDVEGWTKGEIFVFPEPELGYSVSYESSEGGRVTVYVYNGGIQKIADGHDSDEIRDQLKKAREEIDKVVDLGYYEKADTVKRDVVAIGSGLQAQREVVELVVSGKKMTSEIYLFGHKNQFVKIRATRALETEGAIHQSVRRLFEAIAEALAEGRMREIAGPTEGD